MGTFLLKSIFILLTFSSYLFSKNESSPLPGKIAAYRYDSIYVFDHSNATKCRFSIKGKNFSYGGFRWMNRKDHFIGVEYLENEKSGIDRGNIAHFNLSGKLIKRIYTAKPGEIPGYTHLSKSDKRLLFIVDKKGDISKNPLEGLNRMRSIVIMDNNSNKVEKILRDIGTSLNLSLYESPWLYDENSFIYCISDDKQFIIDSARINPLPSEEAGIYIYDVVKNHKTMLVSNGQFPISSPTGLFIGFVKDQSVWVMDLNKKSSKKVFEFELKDRIINIHWTPNGELIYFAYYQKNAYDRDVRTEKLVDVKTGSEVQFQKMGIGFGPYTWK